MAIAERTASCGWDGDLTHGTGVVSGGSGALPGLPVTWASRTERSDGKTNPEELIAAAHASCFSMALAHELAQAGFPAKQVRTTARVHLEKKGNAFEIPRIDLETEADVPNIDPRAFDEQAQSAKRNCPVS